MVVAQCKSIENAKQESYTSKRDITTIASCQFEIIGIAWLDVSDSMWKEKL